MSRSRLVAPNAFRRSATVHTAVQARWPSTGSAAPPSRRTLGCDGRALHERSWACRFFAALPCVPLCHAMLQLQYASITLFPLMPGFFVAFVCREALGSQHCQGDCIRASDFAQHHVPHPVEHRRNHVLRLCSNSLSADAPITVCSLAVVKAQVLLLNRVQWQVSVSIIFCPSGFAVRSSV